MKIGKIDNNKQSFGWRFDTHSKITTEVLKHFPNLKKHEDMIMFGVDSMTDGASCKNIMSSFIRNYSSNDIASLYVPRTSFDLYYENLISSINHFEDKNTEGVMKMVGENILYLQDVASPLITLFMLTKYFLPALI